MKQFWILLVAIVLGVIGKWIGRFVAKIHFTDPTSALLTVAAHRAALRKVGGLAIGAFAVGLVMVCLSPFIAHWITLIGWMPLLVLNACLALLAGTAGSLAVLLNRPFQWDALEQLIDQKKRLIEILKRFAPAAVILLVASSLAVGAAENCAFITDPTPSVRPDDAAEAVEFMVNTAPEASAAFGCRRIVTMAIGCDVRHARRKWIDVPQELPRLDCSTVEPDSLSGHSEIWDHVVGVREARRAERAEQCEKEATDREKARIVARHAFTEEIRSSMSRNDRANCSRIAELVESLIDSGLYRLIVVSTDAIENSSALMRRLVVPDGMRVVVLLCRPDPKFARIEDGLARAAEWGRVPGVTVVTVAELTPDFWRTVAGGANP